MSKFKNRIITISGEPASGKSTVINKLKEDYEKLGYNVHIFSIGHEFRKIAQEKGLSIEELNKYMIERGNIDEIIDSAVAKRGEEINSKERENDIYIFDSRLAFHNIPNSFSVRLTVDDNVAGKRVFEDNKRGKEDSYSSLEEAIEKTHKRKVTEVERYLKRYGINLTDTDNYKLVIDTSYSSIEDIADTIEKCLELDIKDRTYGKMWTSPKKLLPLQDEMSTISKGTFYTLQELRDKIEKEGYNPSSEIEVVNVDGRLSIIEGHHRNFAAGHLGKTLVPYNVIAKNDENLPGSKNTARQRDSALNRNILWGHEWFFDEQGKPTFSYNSIYPGIMAELAKREEKNIGR